MNLLNILLDAPAASFPFGGGNMSFIIMMVALFAIMYFFMFRPQQKKQKQLQEARNAIKAGDKVITAGGIHGKVKNVDETTFTIEIADNTRIVVEKTSVFAAVQPGQEVAK